MLAFSYQHLIKPLAFQMDPEKVHDDATSVGHFLGKHAITRSLTHALFAYNDPRLKKTVAGLTFKNPIGLAAGFDKNAKLIDILPYVGFGSVEVGSITAKPCAGNPKPRLWRLPKSQGLVVHYGLMNDGVDVILDRISKSHLITSRRSGRLTSDLQNFQLGVSVAKTNSPDTCNEEAGIADYLEAFRKVNASGLPDYITINVSCPNAFGGEPFTTPEKLERLSIALKTETWRVPMFIKLPCDLDLPTLDGLLDVSMKYGYAGVILSNLTKDRVNNPTLNPKELERVGKGGIGGKPTFERSNALIAHARSRFTSDKLAIIGCGGVFSGEDAKTKMDAGADLVQLISGMIFQGPQLIGEINREIAKK